MKRIIYILLTFLLLNACKKEAKQTEKRNIFYTFRVDTKVKSGQTVLAPTKLSYKEAVANGLKNSVFVFYPRKVIYQHKDTVFINEFDDTVALPASLIIPIPQKQTAHKGDLLLTWWQKGTGMQRAVCLSEKPTSKPLVFYIDNQSGLISPWKNTDYWIDSLPQGTFRIIKDSIMPGIAVTTKEEYSPLYYVISKNNDSILVLNWAGALSFLKYDQIIKPSITQKLQTGDSIIVPYVGLYSKGVVSEVWDNFDKLKAQIYFLDTTLTIYANTCDAIKIKQ